MLAWVQANSRICMQYMFTSQLGMLNKTWFEFPKLNILF